MTLRIFSLILGVVAVFAAGAWSYGSAEVVPAVGRDPAEWPFGARSPWNVPIGSGAVFEEETSVGWDRSLGGYANIEWYSIATYVARPSDPLRKIYDRHKAPYPGMPKATIRLPEDAVPPMGTDGNMNVIDETHSWSYEMYQVERLGSGDLSTNELHRNNVKGDGLAWGGTMAAQISSLGGTIRKGELVTGTGGLRDGIRHALNGIVPPTGLNRYSPLGYQYPVWPWNAHVWPANSSDPPPGYARTGNVFMGSLLAIPPGVNINSLGITDPQALAVARAMQDYGVYITDTGSTGGKLVIRIDPQAGSEIANRNAFQSGISRAMRELMVVKNSHDNGARPPWGPGGGGTPRRPPAPPFVEQGPR